MTKIIGRVNYILLNSYWAFKSPLMSILEKNIKYQQIFGKVHPNTIFGYLVRNDNFCDSTDISALRTFLLKVYGSQVFLFFKGMAKRIASSSANWELLLQVVSPETKSALVAFKAQSDKYLRDIAELPTELPKIDWGFYKSQIAAPGVVDSYQKSYEGIKIPYPSDQGWIAKVEADGQKRSSDFEKIRLEGLKEIAKLKEKLKELEKEIPLSQATLEEVFLMKPELRISPDNPKLWPQFLEIKGGVEKSDH